MKGNREKGVSVGEKRREKYDQCSSFLTECVNEICNFHNIFFL